MPRSMAGVNGVSGKSWTVSMAVRSRAGVVRATALRGPVDCGSDHDGCGRTTRLKGPGHATRRGRRHNSTEREAQLNESESAGRRAGPGRSARQRPRAPGRRRRTPSPRSGAGARPRQGPRSAAPHRALRGRPRPAAGAPGGVRRSTRSRRSASSITGPWPGQIEAMPCSAVRACSRSRDVEVGAELAVGVRDHRRTPAEHGVAGQHRALLRAARTTASQRCGPVWPPPAPRGRRPRPRRPHRGPRHRAGTPGRARGRRSRPAPRTAWPPRCGRGGDG